MMMIATFAVLSLCAVASTAQSLPEAVELETHSFVTKLDHFRPLDERYVNITYHANVNHYQPGGPFYIFVKDVYDRSTQWIERGLMVDIARNTSGALFTYDPRYYGHNQNVTAAVTLADLQFLTPEQTLEDLATFVEHLHSHSHFSDAAPVIVWGSGYGASTATWARKKFPHLIDAVWSSSGVFDVPVATLSVLDTLSYTIHRAVGYECRTRLSEALWHLNSLVQAGDAKQIAEALSLCSVGDLDDEQEVSRLFETVLAFVTNNVEQRHTQGLRTFCASMETPAGEPLRALGRWINYAFGNDECRVVSYAGLVAAARNEELSAETAVTSVRQATYTQCTQTGLFQITDSVTWLPNRVPLSYYQRRCEDALGAGYRFEELERANAALQRRYGAQHQHVTNVLYTNGMIDTWFNNGIVYSRDEHTTVLNIEHFARSADLGSIAVGSEASALTAAKQAIFDQVVLWSREL